VNVPLTRVDLVHVSAARRVEESVGAEGDAQWTEGGGQRGGRSSSQGHPADPGTSAVHGIEVIPVRGEVPHVLAEPSLGRIGGFDSATIRDRLNEAGRLGYTVEMVDTGTLPDRDRESAYTDVATSAVYSRIRVRRVFGSNRRSGYKGFGTQVPALVVCEEGRVVDVYSHEVKRGPLTTIRAYLDNLLAE
jgi:hypothetical protein